MGQNSSALATFEFLSCLFHYGKKRFRPIPIWHQWSKQLNYLWKYHERPIYHHKLTIITHDQPLCTVTNRYSPYVSHEDPMNIPWPRLTPPRQDTKLMRSAKGIKPTKALRKTQASAHWVKLIQEVDGMMVVFGVAHLCTICTYPLARRSGGTGLVFSVSGRPFRQRQVLSAERPKKPMGCVTSVLVVQKSVTGDASSSLLAQVKDLGSGGLLRVLPWHSPTRILLRPSCSILCSQHTCKVSDQGQLSLKFQWLEDLGL